MTPQQNLASRLKTIQIAAIAVSVVLIGSMLSLVVLTKGWAGLVSDDAGSFVYALGFWLASGVVAGLVLGKMDAVVAIGNAEQWTRTSALDSLIVTLSCATLSNGRVVQLQIANLLSGPVGVGIVYLSCLALHAITGNATLGQYPGYTLMIIPFVTAWKLVENWTRNRIISRHFQACPQA